MQLIDETGEQDKYKAGTIITYTLNDNPYIKPDLSSVVSYGQQLKVGSIVERDNISSPVTVAGVGQVNDHGYYIHSANKLKFEVLELNEKTFSIKLLEDLKNVGQDQERFAQFEYNLVERSTTTLNPDGSLKNSEEISPKWIVSVTNASGRQNTYPSSPRSNSVGSNSIVLGTISDTPTYRTVLNILDDKGDVLAQRQAMTAYLPADEAYTLAGPESLKVGDKTYYPFDGLKAVDGKSDPTKPVE